MRRAGDHRPAEGSRSEFPGAIFLINVGAVIFALWLIARSLVPNSAP